MDPPIWHSSVFPILRFSSLVWRDCSRSVRLRVKELHQRGAELYCWSTGGAQYARESARQLAIEECFTGFLPKPNVLIDDQRPSEWRGLVYIHPNEAVSMSLEDYQQAVEAGRLPT